MSVPDAEMLIKIADALETSVGTLLGAPVSEHNKPEDMNLLAKRLDELNEIFAAQMEKRRRIWRMLFIVLGILSMITCVQGIFHCVHWYQSNNALNSNTAIIGGADGPTSIYVSNISLRWYYLLLNGLIAALSVVGLIKTRRR